MSLIEYETRGRVAVITLNRPQQANAQDPALLKELDQAFDRGADDEDVRVIVLRANGKHFSSGHDISPDVTKDEPWKSMFDSVSTDGLLRMYSWERLSPPPGNHASP
jgi:enoyl-CoA hydratase